MFSEVGIYMKKAVILRDNKLHDFINDNKLDCNSIILSIDEDKKEAYYIIDGSKKVECNYEIIKKYM